MKKILFNDMYGLTKAVLEGRKTITRRVVMQPPYDNYGIAFPAPDRAFDETDSLCGAFCWVNKDHPDEHTGWIRPQWRDGEEVAIAQSYNDVLSSEYLTKDKKDGVLREVEKNSVGCSNKMFVKAELMPHRIRITNVSLERLQDISNEDCMKEGVVKVTKSIGGSEIDRYYLSQEHRLSAHKLGWGVVYDTPKIAFSELIERVSTTGTWNRNPYVFVYEFELIK